MPISQELNNLIQEYISDFINKQTLSCVVKPSIPIVWFGDMEKYEESPQKVVTVAINPSLAEFREPRFDIVNLNGSNAVDKLVQTLNEYFEGNPYERFFNNFEKVLSSLDTSYYNDKKATNIAIHIDIYSAIATDTIWKDVSEDQKKCIKRIDLFKKLLHILNPDIILFSVSEEAFNAVFRSTFSLEKSISNINGKKSPFIRKYKGKKDHKILISGRNLNGTPFGGLNEKEIQDVMTQLL